MLYGFIIFRINLTNIHTEYVVYKDSIFSNCESLKTVIFHKTEFPSAV